MLSSHTEQAKRAAAAGNLKLLKYYVARGVDMEVLKNDMLADGCFAGYDDIVKYLVEEHEADIECFGGYPLQVAAGQGRLEIIKYLISKGADPLYGEQAAFSLACKAGHLETARFFIEECGCHPSVLTPYRLRLIRQDGHNELVDYIETRMNLEYLLQKGPRFFNKIASEPHGCLEKLREKSYKLRFDGKEISLSGITVLILSKRFDHIMALHRISEGDELKASDLLNEISHGIRNIDLLKDTAQMSLLFNDQAWAEKPISSIQNMKDELPPRYQKEYEHEFTKLKRKMLARQARKDLKPPPRIKRRLPRL